MSPFNVTFFEGEDLPEVVPSSYMVEIQSDKANPDESYTIRDVHIAGEATQVFESDRIKLSGNVLSEFDEPIRFVTFGAVFYDADGTVVGLDETYVNIDTGSEILPPGETASFGLEFFERDFFAVPASYRIFVEGARIYE